MRKTDLGGYDAMIFRFPGETAAPFYMANVPVPLSIAWFAADGRFVSSTDMPVCGDDPARCPRFRATAPYRFAVEVLQGSLDDMGIGPGSSISVNGPCR